MRVISGKYKGKRINGYDIDGTRPTMDRVKESMFGTIQDYIKDSVVLDLFAGSGNLGIEALSNGALKGYFVDNNKKVIDIIKKNIDEIGIKEENYLLHMDYKEALHYFSDNNIQFNIIFVDPPYKMKIGQEIIDYVTDNDMLLENGILVVECQEDSFNINNKLKVIKDKKYGDKKVYIFQKLWLTLNSFLYYNCNMNRGRIYEKI